MDNNDISETVFKLILKFTKTRNFLEKLIEINRLIEFIKYSIIIENLVQKAS